MTDKNDSYKGLHFIDELLKEHGSAKACYEFIRDEEYKKIKEHFFEWYDNYIVTNHNAPNCIIPIFFSPLTQNMDQNPDYREWIKKRALHETDKILLFFTSIRFYLQSNIFGKTENFDKDLNAVIDLLWNQFDLYSRKEVVDMKKDQDPIDDIAKATEKLKESLKDLTTKEDDKILKKMFDEL